MSDHLPECDEPYYRELFARPNNSDKCFMCVALRSVRQDVIRENGDWIHMPTAALDQIKKTSYADGVTSAKIVVAGLYPFGYERLMKSLDSIKGSQ